MTRPGVALFILALLLLHTAMSIKVDKVLVPPVAYAGKNVRLECLYEEDGDKLYSLKWWRGDDQFYQYVPPSRNAFPVDGVAVNMSATALLNSRSNGQEVVELERVGLDTAGVYKCEVMADTSFQTEFREANMTVIYLPDGPPTITPALGTHSHNITVGQRVTLRCSSRPASPPPHLTWLINGRHVNSSWVTAESPIFQRNLARVSSKLTFVVSREVVVGGEGGVEVTCLASQTARGKHITPLTASFHLNPSSPLSFWERIFSSGSSVHPRCCSHHTLLLLTAVLLCVLSSPLVC